MKQITLTRKKVATMANRFKKMGLTLSEAFKKAWAVVKGGIIRSKVAGTTQGNRQKALERIANIYKPNQIDVHLVRDKANLYDANAVKVVINVNGSADYELGFIPRNLAYVISTIMDKEIPVEAKFEAVNGKYADYMNYGALISLNIA